MHCRAVWLYPASTGMRAAGQAQTAGRAGQVGVPFVALPKPGPRWHAPTLTAGSDQAVAHLRWRPQSARCWGAAAPTVLQQPAAETRARRAAAATWPAAVPACLLQLPAAPQPAGKDGAARLAQPATAAGWRLGRLPRRSAQLPAAVQQAGPRPETAGVQPAGQQPYQGLSGGWAQLQPAAAHAATMRVAADGAVRSNRRCR